MPMAKRDFHKVHCTFGGFDLDPVKLQFFNYTKKFKLSTQHYAFAQIYQQITQKLKL